MSNMSITEKIAERRKNAPSLDDWRAKMVKKQASTNDALEKWENENFAGDLMVMRNGKRRLQELQDLQRLKSMAKGKSEGDVKEKKEKKVKKVKKDKKKDKKKKKEKKKKKKGSSSSSSSEEGDGILNNHKQLRISAMLGRNGESPVSDFSD
eukprot:CAMPEP_0204349514 /NCGR_PEP_ID=MMETSP0469-20131031/29586_1 /ASSEMBLY_ACC=CAM_ASM_000384 /TAXON_ID=2969 /ORGANISM="Oxyrrhis marina" /LENGTH=151 /DNA_ID=CAMNT_0051335717 /DNA_START=31 /DNA_END=486 /DNA_ORIENTATION=-